MKSRERNHKNNFKRKRSRNSERDMKIMRSKETQRKKRLRRWEMYKVTKLRSNSQRMSGQVFFMLIKITTQFLFQ